MGWCLGVGEGDTVKSGGLVGGQVWWVSWCIGVVGVIVAKKWWVGWGPQVVGGWGQVWWVVGWLGQGVVGGGVVGAYRLCISWWIGEVG